MSAGFKSLGGFPLGGGVVTSSPPLAGFRSLLALWLGGGAAPTSSPTPTPTPTPAPVSVPLAGGWRSYGIQDKFWREIEKRHEKKKKQAKKKSSLAVDIVEEIAATQHMAEEALARLSLELERMNIREAAVYRDLLKLEMDLKQRDDDDDDEDALLMMH